MLISGKLNNGFDFVLLVNTLVFIKDALCLVQLPSNTGENKTDNFFEDALKKTTFVDKTLMIKEVLELSPKTIPMMYMPKSTAKTTNLHMLKTFLEIRRGYHGRPLKRSSTKNYKLFMNHSLKITQYPALFEKHFGTYSIMHIDFSTMRNVTNYQEIMMELRSVIRKTFLKHKYFLREGRFWQENNGISKFISYVHPYFYKNINETSIIEAFNFLAKILYQRFARKVYLLIDDYDSYAENIIFKDFMNLLPVVHTNKTFDERKLFPFLKDPEAVKAVKLMQTINYSLLSSNPFIHSAFLCGFCFVPDFGIHKLATNIALYAYMQNNTFSEYYGMTEDELKSVIAKMGKRPSRRAKIKRYLEKFVTPTRILWKNLTMYDMAPTQNFLTMYPDMKFFLSEGASDFYQQRN